RKSPIRAMVSACGSSTGTHDGSPRSASGRGAMPVSVGVSWVATVPGVSFTWSRVRYDSVDAQLLIGELQIESYERYGGPDETPVDPDEFAHPDGVFFVAREGTE